MPIFNYIHLYNDVLPIDHYCVELICLKDLTVLEYAETQKALVYSIHIYVADY